MAIQSKLTALQAKKALERVAYDDNDIPVLLVFGQSNTDGRGNTSDLLNLDTTFSGEVRIWNKSVSRSPSTMVNHTNNGAWKDYALGDMVVSPQGASATAFGVELPIAIRWRDEIYGQQNKPLHIVKLAVGGTPLYPLSGSIDSNWSDADNQLEKLARDFLVIPAIRELQMQGLNPKCVGIIWGQGESDCGSATASSEYEVRLRDLLSRFRTGMGFPAAKSLIMGLSDYDTSTNWNTVRTAQEVVGAELNNEFISTNGSDLTNEVSRYYGALGAGEIHYSSDGLLTLGSKYFDALDFAGSDYVEPYDYALIGTGVPYGKDFPSANVFNDLYGRINYSQFPTSGLSVNALTWVKNAGVTSRPNAGSQPSPSLKINEVNAHEDIEIIFRMAHDGDINTKPGIFIRAGVTDTDNTSGYLVQVRLGGGQLTIFRNDGAYTFTALTGSPVTPTQSPLVGDLYWYKVTMIGSVLTVYNSPDGKVWTQQFQATDATYTSGDAYFSLFNGGLDKPVGNLLMAHCAFDYLTARKL